MPNFGNFIAKFWQFKKDLIILLPENGNKMKFGEKLKELRLSKQLTQRQIADELGVAPSIYNRFEKNERKVKREFLSKLAVLLDIHEEDLTKYWIADQVYKLLENESNPQYVISMVAEDLTEYGIKNL